MVHIVATHLHVQTDQIWFAKIHDSNIDNVDRNSSLYFKKNLNVLLGANKSVFS